MPYSLPRRLGQLLMAIANPAVVERSQTAERGRAFYLGMAVLLGGVLAATCLLEPSRYFSICAFRMLTGLPCMTCGLTRALHALSTGHFREAVTYHPLGPLIYGLTVFHFLVACLRLFGWEPQRLLLFAPVSRMARIILTLLFACWVVRLLAIAIP